MRSRRNNQHRSGARIALGALALLGGACTEEKSGPAGFPGADGQRLSALLVTLDTTRADALSCYRGPGASTPVLDALAAESVLYERAFTPVPITLPAHASALTGLYPLRHGVRDNAIAALDASAVTVAEAARTAGVDTGAFVGAVVLDRSFGLDQGFDVYDGPSSQRGGSGDPSHRPARAVIDAALAWLDGRASARPFFLWVHLYDAHHPYTPHDAPGARTEKERYLAEVHEMDAELERLFARFREPALRSRTLVCVTADHGEAFGEHLELSHGPFCWNTTLSVPLLIRAPDGARAGTRSQELVSLVDVAPTLAEALGATLPAGIDGRSLSTRVPDERGLYFESMAGYVGCGWSPLAGWLDARGKYLHCPEPQFFDLARDPGEEHDLAAERSAELERYRGKIGAVAALPALARASNAVDEDLRADIQGLGYAAFDATGGAFPHPLASSARPCPHAMVGPWRESLGAVDLMSQERWDEARAIFARLLEGNPGNAFLRGKLATCLMRLDAHQEALDVLRPLLAEPLVDPQNLYRMGACAAILGRREEALDYLGRAVALAPNEARFRERLERVKAGGEPPDE